MTTVETADDDYQSLERIRTRVDYQGSGFFDHNAQLQFDELLVELERESRGIFESHWGDETPLEETDRVDEKRATDDAAIDLVYPVREVTEVEYKVSQRSEWKPLSDHRYDSTNHRLVLARRPNTNAMRHRRRSNRLAADAERGTWRDLAAKIRVTYDRGFGEQPPSDVLGIQIDLINNMLRQRKREQTVAAASPEQFAGQTETEEVVTEEIRDRIADVTTPSMATFSV